MHRECTIKKAVGLARCKGCGQRRPPVDIIQPMEVIKDRVELLRRLPSGGVAAEIGVFRGEYSRRILNVNKPNVLHLVDSWIDYLGPDHPDKWVRQQNQKQQAIEAQYKKVLCEFGDNPRTQIHRMSSAEWMNTTDVKLDWIYIDADHSFDSVYSDLVLSSRLIKPDGRIAGHDYSLQSVYQVAGAVDKFCREHRWQIEYITSERKTPSYCLHREPTPKTAPVTG